VWQEDSVVRPTQNAAALDWKLASKKAHGGASMRLRNRYIFRLGAMAVSILIILIMWCAFAPAQSSQAPTSQGQSSQDQSSSTPPSAPAQAPGAAPTQPVAPAAPAQQPTVPAQQPAGQPLQQNAVQTQAAPDQQPPAEPAPGAQPAGQEAAGDDQGRFVFRKQVEEVVLHATVVDQQGRLITNLDRSAFFVFQNDKPEAVTSFRREDVPVSIGIVVDNSGSMRDKRQKISEAVLNLIRASNPQDESFVVNFDQTPYLDQDFTSDVSLLQTALHQVSARGTTALYDAVVASAAHLQNNPQLSKKVLLVITDGEDNMSRETLQEAIRLLQTKKGPTVYAIGLTDEGMTSVGRQALQSLAAATGGSAFFPQSINEVDAITRSVARDIRSQYTLAYNPGSGAGKSGYQTIRVEARAPGYGPLVVRTRGGYYPGEALR
jgi:Ca-activated chloride channel homolog